MTKILLILVIAAVIESIGVAILSKGLKEIPEAREMTAREIARVIKCGAMNAKVLTGTALEAVFYGALLYMLKVRDLSFIWPLTSMGFVVTALAARFLLGEKVSGLRWSGVLMIALGAFLISYSERDKEHRSEAGPAASSAPFRPE
jgi:drug/metabolite transporter (DMT)-like permease